MNDNNLRDRIAAVIDRGLATWDVDPFDTRTDTEAAAQSVIDELGLTVDYSITTKSGKRHAVESTEQIGPTLALLAAEGEHPEDVDVEERYVTEWEEMTE